jgi:electron transfer flavoprotein beta subunit
MRAIVSCKRVIDYAVRIRVKSNGEGVEKQGVKHSMNPFDEIAVEETLRWKESGHVDEIVAISCGDKQAAEVLKTALAMGADRAIHFEHANELTPMAVAKILSKVASVEKADIVILGKQAIDDDSGQTGQLLAGILNWPQATFASKTILNRKERTAEVTREIDGGLQTVKMKLPGVITVDLRLNEPRYATLQNTMKAKSKPTKTVSAKDLGLASEDLTPQYQTVRVEEPAKRKGGIMVGSVDELLEKIRPILQG